MASQNTSILIVQLQIEENDTGNTGLCEGNPPMTGGFPSQRASIMKNVSIWWRHHVVSMALAYDKKTRFTETGWWKWLEDKEQVMNKPHLYDMVCDPKICSLNAVHSLICIIYKCTERDLYKHGSYIILLFHLESVLLLQALYNSLKYMDLGATISGLIPEFMLTVWKVCTLVFLMYAVRHDGW